MQYFGFDRTLGQTRGFSFGTPPPSENLIPTDYILRYDFDNNLLDKSTNVLNGVKTGSSSFVDGRKAGTKAINFVSGCVRTNGILPLNSDKFSMSFWLSTRQSVFAVIAEMASYPTDNTFGALINENASGLVEVANYDGQWSGVSVNFPINNTWHHVVIEVDRRGSSADISTIHIDNVLMVNALKAAGNNVGNFTNDILYIGSRSASSLFFKGKLQDFRLYNRLLTASDRTLLFNE